MPTVDLSEGSLFAGDYRIVGPLAQGGMGSVYVAEQLSTGRRRALKVMHPFLVADDKMVSRFIQEAKVGSLVDSDHVVEVIAAGVDENNRMPWLCMELLEGETLRERIVRIGVLPPTDLEEVAAQLRHALSRAHEKGLVHRDLKPENIFLDRARRAGVPFTVKILDFGIAKLVQQAKGRQASGTQSIGSPFWMAPEQANAQTISPATDVWALGLIAFLSLTGRIYWRTAATDGDLHLTRLFVEILVDPMSKGSERALELAAQVIPGAGFDLWLSRCIARDASQRYPEAGECLDALIEVLSTDELRTPASMPAAAALVSAPTAPASPLSAVDTGADTAPLEEAFEPIIRGADRPSAPPDARPTPSGMGTGQIAALLAGSLLVALLAVFGGLAGSGLFTASDGAAAPATATPDTTGAPSREPPLVPAVDPLVTPTPPVPPTEPDTDASRQQPTGVTPVQPPVPPVEPTSPGVVVPARPRPVATSRVARIFYASVAQPCWEDELRRTHHARPTRMRIEITLDPSGLHLQNVLLPVRWRGVFGACIVHNLYNARFEERPRRTTFVLNLPASR